MTSTTSEPAGGAAGGGLAFRLAGPSDWPLIWPFWHQIVAAGDTYCYDPAMGYDAGRQLWFGSPPDGVWLVSDGRLVSGGRGTEAPDGQATEASGDGLDSGPATVLGSYRLGPNKAGPGSHIGSASYMVSESARGRGIGRAMVLHCLDQARAAGFRGLQFNAVAASNGYAVKLYLDLGFSVIGTVPGGFHHPEQGFVDLLIMFHPL
ncbi:GNAT family N-acetyltransferase [Jatrophihabitans sp.]|uniref:GNAT family N-acetyltransferase n=1 Tax=Jatrophihabitans sp. TaxID=1932789 RepID=UPI002F238EA9